MTTCVRASASSAAIVLAALAGLAAPASAQLREPEVLVVYDSRISDSRLVAEAYAGSSKVPGGVGGVPGARPRVRVVDLAQLVNAGVVPASPDIDAPTFALRIRNPLRAYLASTGLTRQIRCIVLTKGLPHRITDSLDPTLGDNPAGLNASAAAGTFGNWTYASVDSELALLWQNLDAGEDGANADSDSDGLIASPFALRGLPAAAFSNRNIATPNKLLDAVPISFGGPVQNGFLWRPTPGDGPSNLTPGDMYLVTRLDGPSVSVVRDMITRASNLQVDTSSAAVLLDRDGRTFDTVSGLGSPFDTGGADYVNTYNTLFSDGRFRPQNLGLDSFGGYGSFYVGPLITFPPTPTVWNRSLVYIGHYGANHSGVVAPANTTYALSFNYVPGAVFNTMESYNGRDFGGRGPLPAVPQQQASTFLGAGGTFALANVQEPFTFSVPRTRAFVEQFLIGNLTFAEAAYHALPALSWQQIAVGDPLARVRRTSDDINADGRIDIDDVYAWHANPRDINNSGAADGTDLDLLLAAVRGFEHVSMKGDQR